jgi:hypothetical protein
MVGRLGAGGLEVVMVVRLPAAPELALQQLAEQPQQTFALQRRELAPVG